MTKITEEEIMNIKMILLFAIIFIIWLFIVIETIYILYINFYKKDSKKQKL